MDNNSTLMGVIRLDIRKAHGNKFWLVNKWKDICIEKDTNNELLSDREIVQGIKSGNIEIDRRLKEDEILINESEFFRIVEHLNPYCVVDDGRGYKWIRDIVEVKIGKNYNIYDTWFTDDAKKKNELGIIYVNGKRFKKIFCSASHVRQKKAFFVAENLYNKVMQIALAGIDVSNSDNVKEPCKWDSYVSMCCTDSKAVQAPKCVVIGDYEQPITEYFDVISGEVIKNPAKDKKGIKYLYRLNTTPENNVKQTIQILPFDGAGLVDVSLAKKWAEELGLNYIPSAWQFRAMAGVKGNVYTFNIKEFAKTYGVHTITDRWGDSHEIYNKKHELKINCILTESQVKFCKMFTDQQEWEDAYAKKEYGYSRTFNVSDACIPYGKLKKHCILSYQPLQSLELTDEEIDTLCSDTVQQVQKIHTDIDSFSKWAGLDSDEENMYIDPALQALKYNHSLANDEYVHKNILYSLGKYRALNHIRLSVQGNYEVFIPDVFALAQSAFGIPVTGLLKAGQVYNLYWHNQGKQEITMVRFPHIAREHFLADVADENDDNWEEMAKWYQYQDVGYISSIHDSLALRLGGADYDDDHVYGIADDTICNAVKCNPANTIWFERDTEGEAKANKKVLFSDYQSIANSESVGMRNNIGRVVDHTSQLWSLITPDNTAEYNQKIYNYIKVMQVLDSLTIDFAKTAIKAEMPKEIKEALKGVDNPWFFQFRDKETAGSINQVNVKALQNNAEARIKYSDTKSTMNRIAHHMDDNIGNLKCKYDVPAFDWTTLLQGTGDSVDSDIYAAVVKKLAELYQDCVAKCTKLSAQNNHDNDKNNAKVILGQIKLMYNECRLELLQIQPDINKLINDMITACYTEKTLVKYGKQLIWNCFSSQMITRSKGKKSKGKIYNIDKLKTQHEKIVEYKKEQQKRANNRIAIPCIDKCKKHVDITDADKKYINKTLNSQRSKKLYYALLYVWLKYKAINPDAQKMIIENHKREGISQTQISKIAGIQASAWRDSITSLQKASLITDVVVDNNGTSMHISYTPQIGEKIELPATCLKMRHWINRYVPQDKHRKQEAEHYLVSDWKKQKQTKKKQVMCLETGEVFQSVKEAERKTTIKNISNCCNGKYKTAGGYHWQFVENDLKEAE